MYLRFTRRLKDGNEHRYWSIVESKRCAGGKVVQRPVLYLGEINDSQRDAWCRVIEAFDEDSRHHRQLALFPAERAVPDHAKTYGVQVRLDEMQLHRPRQWGACFLACHLYGQLELDLFFAARLPNSREGTRWQHILQTLVCYRLIDPGSEWRLHRQWFEQSAMGDLIGADYSLVEKNALYRCLDKLLEHKDALFLHLRQRWQDLFAASFDVLLYDLTSTYFESDPPSDDEDKRRFGYSRDKRGDCVQVVIALVVTPQGFPLAYEVLPGNTSDKATLRSFLQKIEAHYGNAQRIWVMDRGIPTEEVLEEMRRADPPVFYLVGTPKGRLTRMEKALIELPWRSVRDGVDVKLLEQEQELYVLTKSRDRVHKERAMRRRQLKWLWARLAQLSTMQLKREELLMKLGAARAKAPAAWRLIDVDVPASGATLLCARSQQAATSPKAGRTLSFAHESMRPGARRAVAVLYSADRDRGRLQDAQGRSRIASDLSSARTAHRSPYLRRLPGLLPACHLAGKAQAAGRWAHAAGRARQVRRHPDARRSLPDYGWPHADLEPLYRTRSRPEDFSRAARSHPAAAKAA